MTLFTVTGENRSVFGAERFNRRVRATGDAPQEELETMRDKLVHRYRCCDDDGVTYFWGMCSDDSSFAPLDYLGEGYGCTYIEYKNPVTGEYEML